MTQAISHSRCCPNWQSTRVGRYLQCGGCGTAYMAEIQLQDDLDRKYENMWQPSQHRPTACYDDAAWIIKYNVPAMSRRMILEIADTQISSRVQSTGLRSGWIDAAGRYDLVICTHVLEHLEDPLRAMYRLREMVRPGGHLYIEVPDLQGPHTHHNLSKWHLWHFSSMWPGFHILNMVRMDHGGPRGWPSLRLLLGGTSAYHSFWGQVEANSRAVESAAKRLLENQGVPIFGACEALEDAVQKAGIDPRRLDVYDSFKGTLLGHSIVKHPEYLEPCPLVLIAPRNPESRKALKKLVGRRAKTANLYS